MRRFLTRSRTCLLAGLAGLLLGAPAADAETGIRFGYDAQGDPSLSAAAFSDTAASDVRVVEWRVCPPDRSACEPLPAAAYPAGEGPCIVPAQHCQLDARPGETSPGTTFEAVFETAGTIATRRTSAWAGRLTSSGTPVLEDAVVGRPVRILAGSWPGGWTLGPDVPAVARTTHALYACRDLDGTECVRLATESALPQRWAGWNLFAYESHELSWPGSRLFRHLAAISLAPPPPFWTVGVLPALSKGWTRSAPVQVCCVLPAPEATVVPTRAASPTAAVRARAQRRKGALHVARVACAVRCAVRLTVKGPRGTTARSLAVQGARSLAIPPRRGLLRVRVVVDGKLLASGRSRAR